MQTSESIGCGNYSNALRATRPRGAARSIESTESTESIESIESKPPGQDAECDFRESGEPGAGNFHEGGNLDAPKRDA
jgi:hypothetical protein